MNKKTVLFVDDEVEILNALKRRMRSEPYSTEYATSGREALNSMKQKTVHILVTDMRMPQMDGLQLIRKVEALHPHTIRIVLSGLSDSDTILAALNEGHVHRYITKPWDERDLKITIRQAMQLYTLKEEKQNLIRKLEDKNRSLELNVRKRVSQLMRIEAEAEIGKYTSQIVHNLNSPLQALCGALDLIDFTCLQSNAEIDGTFIRKKLKTALSATDDLKQIISGILCHSRKKTDFHLEIIDINTLVKEEISYHHHNPVFAKHIAKTLHFGENLPAIIGNKIQIKQVVGNLLKNAIDALEHSQDKNLSIETDCNKDYVILRITDSGCGIAEKDKDRIFNSDYTTKPPGKGTGLGLASVREIVTAYNGVITVTSEPGTGATFEVYLPATTTNQCRASAES